MDPHSSIMRLLTYHLLSSCSCRVSVSGLRVGINLHVTWATALLTSSLSSSQMVLLAVLALWSILSMSALPQRRPRSWNSSVSHGCCCSSVPCFISRYSASSCCFCDTIWRAMSCSPIRNMRPIHTPSSNMSSALGLVWALDSRSGWANFQRKSTTSLFDVLSLSLLFAFVSIVSDTESRGELSCPFGHPTVDCVMGYEFDACTALLQPSKL